MSHPTSHAAGRACLTRARASELSSSSSCSSSSLASIFRFDFVFICVLRFNQIQAGQAIFAHQAHPRRFSGGQLRVRPVEAMLHAAAGAAAYPIHQAISA